MSRSCLLFTLRAGACLTLLAWAPLAVAQSREGGYENNLVRPITPRLAGDSTPRAASGITNPVSPRPSVPGQLRRITELRPVAGDIRPVAGDIRPSGGDLTVSGGGIRPVEVVSPLQNDRSFAARLRPHTPANAVTGYAVESGWDDPPWATEPVATPRRDRRGGTSTVYEGAAAAGETIGGAEIVSAPTGEVRASRRYSPPAAARAAVESGDPRVIATSSRARAARGDDHEWVSPLPIPGASSRPRRDVRPDLRMAVRLTSEGKYLGAVDTVRQAVYREPEAFNAERGSLFTDAETSAKLARAIATYRDGPHPGVSQADAEFMVAALSASEGQGDAAFAAIRQARAAGEDRPSGKALHRVLSRGRVTPPADSAAPASSREARP